MNLHHPRHYHHTHFGHKERVYYHHAENFNDYIQAVEEYKKAFLQKAMY
ncbi:hypothetical protein SAMN05444406_10924 [Caldicoprobacter faecalis]|uniref:Uncharacterized protein n=1 Tax=Caldicoprobacter faecalis TaxID=937334 RepID=A0A1I5V0N2_9FIRM|nr:hypothetical protein SAMN05444406_10924 [Caldicoprobacter faecalis]